MRKCCLFVVSYILVVLIKSFLLTTFLLKAEGILTNKEIIERLSVSGIGLNEKKIRWIISNPFYAGYVAGKLVDGKLIKGHHPTLIDVRTFLKANNLLNSESTAGIAKPIVSKKCL